MPFKALIREFGGWAAQGFEDSGIRGFGAAGLRGFDLQKPLDASTGSQTGSERAPCLPVSSLDLGLHGSVVSSMPISSGMPLSLFKGLIRLFNSLIRLFEGL